jgi:hypothetical protein
MVVALVALVVACAGTATAATLITSKNVKNRSLTGRDLKRDTVTGAEVRKLSGRDVIRNGLDGSDIDESTLDPVPEATRAKSADSVAGASFARMAFRQAAGSGPQVVYAQGGLRIQAECSANGQLVVTAQPAGDGAGQLRITASRPGGSKVSSDPSFQGADTADLLLSSGDDVSGTLTYLSPRDEVTTLQYLAHQSGGCVFAGNALQTSP